MNYPLCGETTFEIRKYQNQPARMIQLQDNELQNDVESLNVMLLGDDTFNIRNVEKATIMGELHVVQQRSNSKRVTYLFANAGIQYENQDTTKIILTKRDVQELKQLALRPDYMDVQASKVAPTVIGHHNKKKAILLMSVGCKETSDFRGRIHGLFVGPPGEAKTKLGRYAEKLNKPHSRYSSTQGASGKSITAIIDKENDSYVLRLGVLPQANNSLCVLNEIAALSLDEQRHLFDIQEEGKFSIDKFGFHMEIESVLTGTWHY